ncbi:MAG: hypothetical protein H0V76_03895 [Blastocatellia bacterium]|nr:hypothetical protein [Blastocatellia bacterium]
MAINLQVQQRYHPADRFLPVGLGIMASVFLIAGIAILLTSDFTRVFPYLYLLPWITMILLSLAIPSFVLYTKGKFTFYNPVIYAAISYFLPAFVVGGTLLASGWSQPYYLSFIQNPEYDLPYTTVLVAGGFLAYAIGFMLPIGRIIGERVESILPNRDFEPLSFAIPGIALMSLGFFNNVIALILGLVGYQRVEETGLFDGLIYLTTLFWIQGTFLLWYIVFKQPRFDIQSAVITGILVVSALAKALYAGNRSSLLQVIVVAGLAYLLAGRRLTIKKATLGGLLVFVSIAVGMIYGTTFRMLKGTESRVDIDEYSETVFRTVDHVGRTGVWENFEFAFYAVSERLDTLSSVAVVVSNYERLRPYEEMYGLDNNIMKDLSTFFIPRFIWADKVVASEARGYADLYFDFGENSFAVTPIADLLRNFGEIGVILGMLLLGLIMRVVYRSLIEGQPAVTWRLVLYVMLLISVSFESFYGNLFPNMIRVGFTTIVGIVFVVVIARLIGYRPLTRDIRRDPPLIP